MKQVTTVTDLADLIRAARAARGWSQQHVADAAGVSRRFVNMVEGGKHANAEVGRILALLDALDVRLVASGAQPDTSPALDGAHAAVDRGDDIDLDTYLATFLDPHHGADR